MSPTIRDISSPYLQNKFFLAPSPFSLSSTNLTLSPLPPHLHPALPLSLPPSPCPSSATPTLLQASPSHSVLLDMFLAPEELTPTSTCGRSAWREREREKPLASTESPTKVPMMLVRLGEENPTVPEAFACFQ